MSILRSKHSGWTWEGRRTPHGGGKGSAPPPPDYRAAAIETAQGNLDAARTAVAANRVNQYTPYGSLEYKINPESQWDIYGNPTWSATQSLSPAQQQLLDYQNQASIGLGKLAGQGLGYVENMLATPFNTAALPSTGFNPSQTYQEAYMQRLAPQLQQGREQLQQRLANQGIDIGSEAYDRAMMQQAQRENDLLAAATTQGFGVGQQARQTALQEQAYLRNEPLNTLSAVRTGAQVQGPQFVNSAQQATTSGPDLLGAAQMGYNAQMGAYNAQQAGQNNLTSGLMGLAGTGMMMMCDPRTKENIKAVGVLENGLTLYSFEYKDEFKDREYAGHGVHVGVMADEVEQVYPFAVRTLDDGYKVVDYGLIP
jgi:Chaperone of endosialidase